MAIKQHTIPPLTSKDIKRFWSKVDICGPKECWLWQIGCFRDGYGKFTFPDCTSRASRVAYTIANGQIPEGAFICHTCDNPKCVNPKHLFPSTGKGNYEDSRRKGRNYCGQRVHTAKLTSKQIIAVRSEYATGRCFQKDLARKYGVCQQTISWIVSGGTWKHIA